MIETAASDTEPLLVEPLGGLGTARLGAGRPADAIEPLERAVALAIAPKASNIGDVNRAEVIFALARALRGAGKDPARAKAPRDPGAYDDRAVRRAPAAARGPAPRHRRVPHQVTPHRRSDSAHSRRALTSSRARRDGLPILHFSKYSPEMPSAAGELAR